MSPINHKSHARDVRGDQTGAASVAIRVDSGSQIGCGPLLRCLTLADELQRRGAGVRFVSREHPGHSLARVDEAGYPVHRLPAPRVADTAEGPNGWLGVTPMEDARETATSLRDRQIDWLIADHRGIDAEWEGLVRGAASSVMVIDDLANRPHDAALLLDQNYYGSETFHRYEQRMPRESRCLLGPRYALLQPAYRRLRQPLEGRTGAVRRILVFFGMDDPTHATPHVLRAVSHPDFSGIAVDVVVGRDPDVLSQAQSLARAHPGVTVHESTARLAELMAGADLAVGAVGATTWECACLGVPAVLATVADEQVGMANALAADELTVLVGPSTTASSEVWRLVLRQMIRSPERIATLGYHTRTLTDGYGPGRVARVLLGSDSRVVVRRARLSDESLLLEWANDPETRRLAFNHDKIFDVVHRRWFRARLDDPHCMLLIGEDSHGLPLGQVRFDLNGDASEATINISVDVALRGRGIGAEVLREAVGTWCRERPHARIVAEIVAGNTASMRLFSSAGFVQVQSRRLGTDTFELRP